MRRIEGPAEPLMHTGPAPLWRRKRRVPRSCLCCSRRFLSEGLHNRLCEDCRQIDAGPEVQATPKRPG